MSEGRCDDEQSGNLMDIGNHTSFEASSAIKNSHTDDWKANSVCYDHSRTVLRLPARRMKMLWCEEVSW